MYFCILESLRKPYYKYISKVKTKTKKLRFRTLTRVAPASMSQRRVQLQTAKKPRVFIYFSCQISGAWSPLPQVHPCIPKLCRAPNFPHQQLPANETAKNESTTTTSVSFEIQVRWDLDQKLSREVIEILEEDKAALRKKDGPAADGEYYAVRSDLIWYFCISKVFFLTCAGFLKDLSRCVCMYV